jgi:porin
MRKLLHLALLASSTLLPASHAFAQEEQSPGADRGSAAPAGAALNAGEAQPAQQAPDTLLGDWAGVRSGLKDAGITLSLGYKGEFAANVSGGERKLATENGQFALTGAFDMDRIAGIKGGTLQATVTYRHGDDLSTRAGLGVLQQVQEVYGRGQTWRLTELFYQQRLADDHVILKVGRFPAGDFNTFDCDFMNLTFCGAPAGNITGNYWYNWPIAQWSGWAKFRTDTLYLKLGANEDNRNNLDNAFFFSRGHPHGVILHAEAGWTPTLGNGKLPALIKAGYWHTSGNDPDVLLDIEHQPIALTGLPALQRSGQYGMYLQGEMQVTGDAKRDPISDTITRNRGLNVFFNLTRNDPKTSTQLDQETVGLYYNAPFASRPKDHMGIAVGRTGYNGRAARALLLAAPGSEKPKAEYVGEIYYAAAVIPGLSVRPNVQYILNPGGYSHVTDVVILGTRFDVAF